MSPSLYALPLLLVAVSAVLHWLTDLRMALFSLCSGIMFSDSVCLLIITPAAPKSLYQHGGDTRDFWTASGGSKLFRMLSDRVSEHCRSSPLKAFLFCYCLFVLINLNCCYSRDSHTDHSEFLLLLPLHEYTSSHWLSIATSNTSAKRHAPVVCGRSLPSLALRQYITA